ncbi:MAG: hypothetical protein DWP95_02840 [Proteobacteria bacterium]|nr:MAG: hypothetical protein DWP95_02840 [Pseudomonadota bacterium]
MKEANILTRKLINLFPEVEVRNTAKSILDSYGVESYEQEPVRVRLAIIKLSGSDIEELRKTTKAAKKDFRDILSWAEYPRQSIKWSFTNGLKNKKLAKKDRAEYKKWLNTY